MRTTIIILTLCVKFSFRIFSQYPPDFFEITYGTWNAPIEIEFDIQGTMFVAEKEGKIYKFHNNTKTQILDISEEVGNYSDYGLLSFTLDPNFLTNGYIYLYYVVDRHYLMNFGTQNYSPSISEQGATIARITRYTINTSNFNTVVPNSRFILLGDHKSNGFPLTGQWHAGGTIKFSKDGSLMISCGDGTNGADYEVQAFDSGILSNEEYFGAMKFWRSQMLNSLAGKMIRLNPANGDGLPSNPFFNANSPRSAASRIWARGLRNPFRYAIKPNTGSTNIADGNPGTFYIGDVGDFLKEEINVLTQSGQNFGWPKFEGMDANVYNNSTYDFQNHKRPIIDYGRMPESNARVLKNNQQINVGSQAFPFTNFKGRSSIVGTFYEGTKFPPEYRNSLFVSDFNNHWIKVFSFDNNNEPINQIDFNNNILGAVCFATNPVDKSLYYVDIILNKVAKIEYQPAINLPPVADFNYSPKYGQSPLQVNFDASNSKDPENGSLTYNWNFGNGQTATGKTTSHTFIKTNPGFFEVTLIVTDNFGNTNSITKTVSINNTPPNIISTTVNQIDKFIPSVPLNLNLQASIQDNEEANSTLKYKWEVILFHNDHNHFEFTGTNPIENYTLGIIPCDQELYFYQVKLTVTDSYGLESVYTKDIYPNCNTADNQAPAKPNISISNFTNNSFDINWSGLGNDPTLKNIQIIVNGETKYFEIPILQKYTLVFPENLISGQPFSAKVIARDFASNASESPEIKFIIPSILCAPNYNIVYLSDISHVSAINGFGPIEKDKSNGEGGANDGNILRLNGTTYAKGLGVHAYSEIVYQINSYNYKEFKVKIGLDDEIDFIGCGTARFAIYLDEFLAFESGTFNNNTPTQEVILNIENVNQLKLVVTEAGDGLCGDHANWADAKITSSCLNNDSIAPSMPLNLSISGANGRVSNTNQVSLSWNASNDNVDNSLDYEILLNGNIIGSTTLNSYTINMPTSDINFVNIQAKDNNGNVSISETKTFTINNPLSLQNINLKAVMVAENSTKLNWEVENENQKLDYFELQKSNGNMQFKTIGKLNRNESNKYEYVDNNSENGLNFYRLKIIQNDGKIDYSKIISIKIESSQNFSTVKNPAVEGIINVYTNIQNPHFQAFNQLGKIVNFEKIIKNGKTFELKIPNISGLYFLKITNESSQETKKIMVP